MRYASARENHPTREKARVARSIHEEKRGTSRKRLLSSRGVIFTCARVSHALPSLKKNGGLLVVYSLIKMTGILIGKLESNPREIILGVA